MKFWIDGEWNSYGGELISLALVDEDDAYFYECIPCAAPNPWVAENVIPVIGGARVTSRDGMRASLAAFLSKYPSVHIVADWPEDIAHFCALLISGPGTRINTPPLTMEIRRDLNSDGSVVPHNALEDARSMKRMDTQ